MARPRPPGERGRRPGLRPRLGALVMLSLPLLAPAVAATAARAATVPATTATSTPDISRLQAPCSEGPPRPAASPPAPAVAAADLRQLLQAAFERSQALGAARALADAAVRDVDEARAALRPQAAFSVSGASALARSDGQFSSSALQGGASVSLSQTLWDGGRSQALIDWRQQLAEASRLQLLSQQEQLALTAVQLALERQRLQAHEQVYAHYVNQMVCLAAALQAIVDADRGRASELLQIRKAQQQAELQREQTRSQRVQAEIRLQRLVGDVAVGSGALGQALQALPTLPELLDQAGRATEVVAAEAQTLAAGQLARSVAAANRPRISWQAAAGHNRSAGGTLGSQHGAQLSVGLSLSVPLTDNGSAAATDAAQARALAAQAQLADLLDNRQARVRELHEQARSALDRAERLQTVLATSEQVRQATLLQWQQLGRRSLFDVMSAEGEHVSLRLNQVNSLLDAQQLGATLRSLGPGLLAGLR